MWHWVHNFLGRQMQPKARAKRARTLVAYNMVGQPVWTPRRYDRLAEEGYQRNVIVYRAVSLIARGAASVPWILKRTNHRLNEHPLLSLLHKPNPRQGGAGFMETVVAYLLLSGNSYIEAIVPDKGLPVELHPLRPDRMKVIPGASGLAAAYEYTVDAVGRRLMMDPLTGHGPLLHLRAFHPLNDWYGMSPIEAAATAIDQHNAVANHNLSLLQNGGRPSGALLVRSQVALTSEQRQSLRDDVRDIYEGSRNAGRIVLLEGDFEWKEMGLSPKDLDFISGKNMSAREIAQAYGVPPMLVGVPGDATFANYREARFHLWEDTILPLLDTLIDELNRWLVPYFGTDLSLSYDMDAIPALTARREAMWARISEADFLTINEKRIAVGYTPLRGGDHL